MNLQRSHRLRRDEQKKGLHNIPAVLRVTSKGFAQGFRPAQEGLLGTVGTLQGC